MGIDWDDIDAESDALPVEEGEKNSYLTDYRKGMELIASVMGEDRRGARREARKIARLDRMIDEDLLDSMKNLEIEDEINISRRLRKLSDRVEEYRKNKLLRGQTVLGIGGQFSAGKSAFINSLINSDLLPENQTVTTSIPTYLVYGRKEEYLAFTGDNKNVSLSEEAMKALTHAFFDQYHIGFSGFIKNLIVERPAFSSIGGVSHLAILDTPGYSKADSTNKRTISDYKQAQNQLRSVDFLIWLIDCDGKVSNVEDISFLQSLNVDKPILVVFNKADKKPESDLKELVELTEKSFRNSGINLYGVTCYSSINGGKEYLGKSLIREFLKDAEKFALKKPSVADELKDISENLKKQLAANKRRNQRSRNRVQQALFKSGNYNAIQSLIEIYKHLTAELDEINECQDLLKEVERDINTELVRL